MQKVNLKFDKKRILAIENRREEVSHGRREFVCQNPCTGYQ